MRAFARAIQLSGWILIGVGVSALAGIFLTVLVSGGWPDWLRPVRSAFEALSIMGYAAYLVEFWAFVGPGAVIAWIGSSLLEREARRKRYPTE